MRRLPPLALAPVAAAIFLLFSTIGFLTDIMAGGTYPLPLLLANVLFAGTLAVLYAANVFSWWYLVAGFVLHGLYLGLILLVFETPPGKHDARLTFDAVGVIAASMLSYAFFIIFISNTGTRYIKARAEIELAREIHGVLVPVIAGAAGEYQYFGCSEASGDVGGDLVDVVRLAPDEPRGWIGYVADVSGHGVSSGVLMGMVKSAARMQLRARAAPDGDRTILAPLLEDLNDVLHPLTQSNMFVTMASVADAGGGSLEYALAGHLPILHAAASGHVAEVRIPQLAIGMLEGTRYTSGRLTIEPGDVLALITDGLTEVFDAGDNEFGLERVKRRLAEHRREPLERIASGLLAEVRAYGAQMDDQTILLIRRSEAGREGS